jgi:cytochrome c553
MQAFDALSPASRTGLAREVLRLRREAAREQIAWALRDAGEEPDEEDVRMVVERTTTPGPPILLPQHWRTTEHSAAKGKADYQSLGCAKCHGDDGTGTPEQRLFDAQGEPNRARDLVHEPFKGGRERESISLRLVAGMPGTAHPAAPGLSEEQLSGLVEYVRSLARRPECALTNHDRRTRADPRLYLEWLGRGLAVREGL